MRSDRFDPPTQDGADRCIAYNAAHWPLIRQPSGHNVRCQSPRGGFRRLDIIIYQNSHGVVRADRPMFNILRSFRPGIYSHEIDGVQRVS